MIIRPINKGDIDDIIAIEKGEFTKIMTPKEILDAIASPLNPSAVAQNSQGKVVGFIICSQRRERTMGISCITVADKYRRGGDMQRGTKGVGTLLFEYVESKLRSQSNIAMSAVVPESRVPAQCFLRSMGFRCNESKEFETGIPGKETITGLRFRYTVPFDILSDRDLSKMSSAAKDRRVKRLT
jgi:ribosomal protein S18 acetylase RimI-like enzyme